MQGILPSYEAKNFSYLAPLAMQHYRRAFQNTVLGETYIDRQFNDIYVTCADIRIQDLQFDRAEVSGVKFVPFDSFLRMALDESLGFTSVYANECRDLMYFLAKSSLFRKDGNDGI